MEWLAGVAFFLAVQYLTSVSGIPLLLQPELNSMGQEEYPNPQRDGEDAITQIQLYQDMKLEQLGKVLTNILIQPWPQDISPILYVEELNRTGNNNNQLSIQSSYVTSGEELNSVVNKRTRYYRRYPWKRQNSRYDPENRYLCQPSKEDVFRLLVALHEARQGSKGQTVNFCNRKRPASVVFTNIRFLG